MTRMRWTALITIAALAAGTLALAAGPGRRAGRGRGDHMAQALQLTPTQRQQMLDIRTRHWNDGLGAAVKDAREAHLAIRHAVQDPNATDDQVAAAVRASTEKLAKVAVLHHRLALDMEKVLTPEQLAKFRQLQSMREERGDRMMGAMDGFFGAGPGGPAE